MWGSLKSAALLLAALAIVGALSACKSADRVDARALRIRYCSLSLALEYLVTGDPEARALRDRKRELVSASSDMERRLLTEKDIKARESLVARIRDYRDQAARLAADENRFKEKFYTEINRAIESVASRMRIDFVYNMGEGLVYSRREYDITEDILKELGSVRKRNAPPSR